MTIDTLPSTPAPDQYDASTEISNWEADFGDGYSQRAPKGINNTKDSVPLNWTNLTKVEMIVLRDFCIAHSGGQTFYFTLEDEDDPKKFALMSYVRKYVSYDNYTFTLNMKQVYDV